MHAADHRKTHAQVYDADKKQDEDRPDNSEFDRGRATLVAAYSPVQDAHG
jgi:hypothetical protein